ncbi:MAG: hypothetical protein H6646_03575 [Anaerolineales bacterium]|nr:hypothetical protein [Anaerolineales bacterium]
MIADLKPYPAYKDSGVPWLGEIPEHWEILPNRAVFTEIKERNHPDADMLSVTISKGVIRQRALLEDSSKKDSGLCMYPPDWLPADVLPSHSMPEGWKHQSCPSIRCEDEQEYDSANVRDQDSAIGTASGL